MFICNFTIKVDNEIVEQWLQWQKEEQIPEVMATKLFIDNKIFKLLGHDEPDSSTYVLQFFTESEENFGRYLDEYAPALNDKASKKWGDRFIAFGTVMQTVH
jgi:hypothetical protein